MRKLTSLFVAASLFLNAGFAGASPAAPARTAFSTSPSTFATEAIPPRELFNRLLPPLTPAGYLARRLAAAVLITALFNPVPTLLAQTKKKKITSSDALRAKTSLEKQTAALSNATQALDTALNQGADTLNQNAPTHLDLITQHLKREQEATRRIALMVLQTAQPASLSKELGDVSAREDDVSKADIAAKEAADAMDASSNKADKALAATIRKSEAATASAVQHAKDIASQWQLSPQAADGQKRIIYPSQSILVTAALVNGHIDVDYREVTVLDEGSGNKLSMVFVPLRYDPATLTLEILRGNPVQLHQFTQEETKNGTWLGEAQSIVAQTFKDLTAPNVTPPPAPAKETAAPSKTAATEKPAPTEKTTSVDNTMAWMDVVRMGMYTVLSGSNVLPPSNWRGTEEFEKNVADQANRLNKKNRKDTTAPERLKGVITKANVDKWNEVYRKAVMDATNMKLEVATLAETVANWYTDTLNAEHAESTASSAEPSPKTVATPVPTVSAAAKSRGKPKKPTETTSKAATAPTSPEPPAVSPIPLEGTAARTIYDRQKDVQQALDELKALEAGSIDAKWIPDGLSAKDKLIVYRFVMELAWHNPDFAGLLSPPYAHVRKPYLPLTIPNDPKLRRQVEQTNQQAAQIAEFVKTKLIVPGLAVGQPNISDDKSTAYISVTMSGIKDSPTITLDVVYALPDKDQNGYPLKIGRRINELGLLPDGRAYKKEAYVEYVYTNHIASWQNTFGADGIVLDPANKHLGAKPQQPLEPSAPSAPASPASTTKQGPAERRLNAAA